MPEIRNYTLNFGPQHPAAHGVLRLPSLEAVAVLVCTIAFVFSDLMDIVVFSPG